MSMMARLLAEAGKTVVAWVEQDVPSTIEDLRGQDNCAALVLHDDAPDRQKLEAALARSASMPALTRRLTHSPRVGATPGRSSATIS